MQARIWHAPLMLFALQAAPVGVQQGSDGRVRLSFGYGTGQFEERQLNCSGSVVSARPIPYHTIGGQLDAWPQANFRFTAFGGLFSTDSGFNPASFGSSAPVITWGGAFGGGMIAWEGSTVGVGGGAARIPFDDPRVVPTLYLRLGPRDRWHFRTDVYHPSPVFPTTGVVRAGIEYRGAYEQGAGGMLGISIGQFSDESHLGGPYAELHLPITRSLDFSLYGAYRPGAEFEDWSAAVSLRYTFFP